MVRRGTVEPRGPASGETQRDLTRGQRWRTGALAGLVTTLSIGTPTLAATLLLILTGWSFLLVNLVTSLVAAVVIPIGAVTMALLHGDLLFCRPGRSLRSVHLVSTGA